jgi:hypothetical protein
MSERKPVKVLTDLETRKQILKKDSNNETLFKVSGTLGNGAVSSSLPITGTQAYFSSDVTVDGVLKAKEIQVTTVINSVNYETSISASINALLDVSASNAEIDQFLKWDGSNWVADNVSNATSASYAATAAYAQTTTFDSTEVVNAYKRLRFQQVGYFDVTGSALIQLPTAAYGGSAFPTASLDYVNINVFVKDDNMWVNDILAVSVYESSSYIYVSLEAPELTNTDQYKLLAINEDPTYYTI